MTLFRTDRPLRTFSSAFLVYRRPRRAVRLKPALLPPYCSRLPSALTSRYLRRAFSAVSACLPCQGIGLSKSPQCERTCAVMASRQQVRPHVVTSVPGKGLLKAGASSRAVSSGGPHKVYPASEGSTLTRRHRLPPACLAVEAASARVAAYDSDLHLLRNNCRHFVAELASELSGVPINPWSLPSDPLHSARPSWTVMR